ncbi:MAG: PrsW family intramembrane metalloprotease [Coriobacteriales bacterium]|nr:PrsW family intramembrane metalloprotease [Coriobacteriales bacterium]
MENLNLFIFIAIMAPLTMMLFVFHGKYKVILGYAMAGIYICMLAGEVNALILNNADFGYIYLTQNISPLTEEFLKCIPIFLLAFLFKPSRQFVIECALALGIGFALMENVAVLFSSGEGVTIITALFRGFGAGMMHGICALFIGLGAEILQRKRRILVPGILGTLSVAIIYHSIYNTIISSDFMMFGIALPLITFIPLLFIMRKQMKK